MHSSHPWSGSSPCLLPCSSHRPVAQRKVGGGGHGLEVRLALRRANGHIRQLGVDGALPSLSHAPAMKRCGRVALIRSSGAWRAADNLFD